MSKTWQAMYQWVLEKYCALSRKYVNTLDSEIAQVDELLRALRQRRESLVLAKHTHYAKKFRALKGADDALSWEDGYRRLFSAYYLLNLDCASAQGCEVGRTDDLARELLQRRQGPIKVRPVRRRGSL